MDAEAERRITGGREGGGGVAAPASGRNPAGIADGRIRRAATGIVTNPRGSPGEALSPGEERR